MENIIIENKTSEAQKRAIKNILKKLKDQKHI